MKASWYAEALYGAICDKSDSDSKKIFARFREVILLRGHGALLRLIPNELEKIATREQSHREVVLVTADAKSRTKWAHAYDHYEKEGVVPKDATRHDVIDESIIGGYQIRTKDTIIDASYKKPLVELYRNIINNK